MALGVAGTVELSDVLEGELIEIVVIPDDDSLTVSVERRTFPEPSDRLPELVEGNDVSILLGAGVYEQEMYWVKGNGFTLTGQAGESCDSIDGWTVNTGDVLVEGNGATFRNIQFGASVTVKGNNRFINCCFNGRLIIFGNNADIGGDDDDGDDDDDDDDD